MPVRASVPLPGPFSWSPPKGDGELVVWLIGMLLYLFAAGLALILVAVFLVGAAVGAAVRWAWRRSPWSRRS